MTIVKELNELSKKMNGVNPKATTDAQAVKFIADNYEGGGGASYTAGDNITIQNNVISATDTKYTAGTNITISDQNVISASGGSNVPFSLTYLDWRKLYEIAYYAYSEDQTNQEQSFDDSDTDVINAITICKQLLDAMNDNIAQGIFPIIFVRGGWTNSEDPLDMVFTIADNYKVGATTDGSRYIEASFPIPFDFTGDEYIRTLHIHIFSAVSGASVDPSFWYVTKTPVYEENAQ